MVIVRRSSMSPEFPTGATHMLPPLFHVRRARAGAQTFVVCNTRVLPVAAMVDSGVEETVVPTGLLPGKAVESPMQHAGGRYKAANGSRVPNLGQHDVAFQGTRGSRVLSPRPSD